MPNKDSFTFSDKLKKSKSLPLSKRIPSKVGGDGKAKRTLIQRAQRDLPFIIVAAAALLLLPILSRNGGTDDLVTEPSMDFVGSPDSTSTTGGLGQEIAPSSGFKNPLDYIITRSGTDSEGVRNGVDTGEEGAGYEATTTPYTSEKEERATETYAPAAKAAIRNATERKATQVNALRNSKTIAASGGTGVSRTLAVGSAAKAASGTSVNPGVRPVALQPMTSAGKGGRSETGEGLYAEAARSVNALNRGSSKQALFDAQLKNVDGSALGSIGGGPNFGSGGRVGAGGSPSNSVSYKPNLPWWWDFEKQKAMKRWELWDYNFQKALSDNIIKVGTSLALCLTTGNADGKVDKFLGDPGGSDDYTCPGGNVQDWETHRDLMGKDESGSGESKETRSRGDFQEWVKLCNASNGNKGYEKTSSSSKNMLDVRLRCLGLKYKNTNAYKFAQKTNYSDKYNCTGVSAGSGIIKFELTAPSASMHILPFVKITKDPSKRMGHYVVAKNMAKKDAQPQVIYIAKGGKLDGVKLQKRIDALNEVSTGDFVATKVVGFTLYHADKKLGTGRADSIQAQINDMKSLGKEEQAKLTVTKTEKDANGVSKKVVVSTYDDQLKALETQLADAKKNSARTEDVSDSDFESILARIDADIQKGDYKSENYVADQLSLKVQKACEVGTKFYATKMLDSHHTLRGSDKDAIACGEPFTYVKLKDSRDFSVTISNPGACTYAVVVEKSPITNDKYIVKHVVDFQSAYYKKFVKVVTAEDKDLIAKGAKIGDKVFKFDSSIGLDESSKIGTEVMEGKNGNGWVFWVTNNSCDGVAVGPNDELSNPDPSNVINSFSAGGQKYDVCQYRWACGEGGCVSDDKPNTEEYCWKPGDNGSFSLFKAVPVNSSISVSTGTKLEDIIGSVKKDAYNKYFLGKKWFTDMNSTDTFCTTCFTDNIHECASSCADKDGNIKIKGAKGSFVAMDPVVKKADIAGLSTENCPECKDDKVTTTPPPAIVKQPSCNFRVQANFASTSHEVTSFNIETDANNFYKDCLSALTNQNAKDINVYVTGFTSQGGDGDLTKCKKAVCVLIKKDSGEEYTAELPNSNVVLSEDRALSVTERVIAKLKEINNRSAKPLPLAYSIDFSRAGDIEGHFAKHIPRGTSEINAIESAATADSNVSSDKVNVKFIVKGVGSAGYKQKGNYGPDRQVTVTMGPSTTRIYQ